MSIRARMLGLLAMVGLPLEAPAFAELVARDFVGYRCYRDAMATGTVIRRFRTGVGYDAIAVDWLCRERCEGTAGCLGFNYVTMRGEAGDVETWCVLLGAVTSTSPWRYPDSPEYREMCYRLAGAVGRVGRPDCPPHKPGCEFDTRGQTGPQRPPSAGPPGKK